MQIRMNARDLALSLRGPGETAGDTVVPDDELDLVIVHGDDEVHVIGPWLLLRRLAAEGLSLPLPESFTPVVMLGEDY